MFERETRREKILEAVDLNKEMQLRMKNKSGFLNLINKGKNKKSEHKELDGGKVKVDPLVEAENDFYRIVNEVKCDQIFHKTIFKLNQFPGKAEAEKNYHCR